VSAGGSYRINSGTYTDNIGKIDNGNTVQVRHTASANFSTSVSSTLTIGGVIGAFTSTTQANDTTPIATLNVKDFGAVGDGETDDTTALKTAIIKAHNTGKNLYFPDGTYLYQSGMNAQGVRFIGQSKTGTIIKESSLINEHNLDGAENITFQNVKITDYGTSKSRIFRNCKFEVTLPVDSSFYLFYTGVYTYGADNEFTDCDFIFPHIYTALWIRKYDSVLIQNCTFNGNASGHNIRLELPNKRNAQVSILGNTITGGTTGIFIGSNREIAMEGGLIEGNTLHNQVEEAIAMDGFGNERGLVPVIANGPIDNVWNDKNGRVVIGMDQMLYRGDTIDAPSPISLRDDWTNFYFSFGEDSGLDGTIAKIQSFNADENTLTLDLKTPASTIKLGGDAGVQGGFFNWIVRGNTVTGTLGYNNTYGTAISIYLNVFGILVENNVVSDSAHALNLAGGQMLTTYRTLAYGNVIRNNTFQNCDKYSTDPADGGGVVTFTSYWGGNGPLQYNNQFINNTIDGGRIHIERQKNLIFEGNTLSNDVDLTIVEP